MQCEKKAAQQLWRGIVDDGDGCYNDDDDVDDAASAVLLAVVHARYVWQLCHVKHEKPVLC